MIRITERVWGEWDTHPPDSVDPKLDSNHCGLLSLMDFGLIVYCTFSSFQNSKNSKKGPKTPESSRNSFQSLSSTSNSANANSRLRPQRPCKGRKGRGYTNSGHRTIYFIPKITSFHNNTGTKRYFIRCALYYIHTVVHLSWYILAIA